MTGNFNGCGSSSMPKALVEFGAETVPYFTRSCNQHDLCWEHCLEDQDSCDQEFLENMIASCAVTAIAAAEDMADPFAQDTCVFQSAILYNAVNNPVSGALIYSGARENAGCTGTSTSSNPGEGEVSYDCFELVKQYFEYIGEKFVDEVSQA